ncbi:outer membrane protein assembly factor BamE [Ferruginivarius sediminum]|nr:outer membrane protein assembly factor BamE [Ferruginivarius sediminum]
MNIRCSRFRKSARALLFAGAASVALAGCDTPVQVRGHMPDEDTVSQVKTGQHSRSDVAGMLGSPSAVSTFEDDTWYYVGSKTKKFAFFEPEVLERKVLVVSFGDGDVVQETRRYTLKDGRAIDPVNRVTPTEGKDLTFLQQLLGNLGRFNADSAGPGTVGGSAPVPGG